jgi:ribosomal protein S7
VSYRDIAFNTTQKLSGALMKKGKKSTAEKVIQRLCEMIETKENKKSMSFIHYAIQAIRPLVG